MAQVSACFVFGMQGKHVVECIVANDDGVVTGGRDGELCVWGNEFKICTVCALPEDSKCLGLCVLIPPIDLQTFFGTSSMIVSLHIKSQLRLWSFTDGKCLTYSNDLFSLHNQLEGIAKVSDFEVAVCGKNEIFIVDAYRMQSLKYFYTESKVLSLFCFGSEVWAQTVDKLYDFNIQGEFDNSVELVIKNRVDGTYPIVLSGNSSFLAVGNGLDLQIFRKGKEISMKKLVQEGVIEWIGWDLNGLMLVCAGIAKFFRLEDVLRGFLEEKVKICVESLELGVRNIGKLCVRGKEIFLCVDGTVNVFDMNERTLKKLETEFEESNFADLNDGEKPTIKNFLIAEEIFLSVGTDSGRVIVFSLFSESKQVFRSEKSSITFIYLHKRTLAISNSVQLLTFWDFAPTPGKIFHDEPQSTVEILTSCIKLIIPLEFVNKQSNENKWENIALGQTETGAILLIDFKSKTVISYFQALKSCILTAVLHSNLDYLALACANGHIYVFNMISLTLEREIYGDAIFNFQLSEKNNKLDRFTVILNGYLPLSIQNSVKVSFLYLCGFYVPVLYLNIEKMSSKKHNFYKKIPKIWDCEYLKEGFCTKTKEISFNYESQSSPVYNSVKIVSFYQLFSDILYIPADLIQLITLTLNPECKFNKVILDFCLNSPGIHIYLQKAGNVIQKNAVPGKNLPKSVSNTDKLSLSEATLISINLIHCILHPPQRLNHFVQDLIALIDSNNNEYSLLACQLIIKGSTALEYYIEESQMKLIIQQLLHASCTFKKASDNENFYLALVSVGLLSVNTFVSILTNEIKGTETRKLHHKIFFTIEHFVLKHFSQATSVLQELADFLLKSHELKNSLGSKRFSSDFSTVLSTFVGLLPMISHTPDTRYLICGLPTGYLLVYDFKMNKKWKPFKLFQTTITALDIKDSLIAAYSSQESFLKVVKMESSLFGLSSGDLKLTDQIPLVEIEPETTSYQEMIKTTKIHFTSKLDLVLYREDKREYKFTVRSS